MEDLAIYVNSFDGYSDIWPYFFQIFDKFWKNCPYPLYLSSNILEYNYQNLTVLKVGKETNWINRTINTVKRINEEYILFMLEDYFISKEVDNKEIFSIIKHMSKNNLFYYQLTAPSNMEKGKKHITIKGNQDYPISLQLAIWKRTEFIKILEKINRNAKNNSPWDFERFFYRRFIAEPEKQIEGIEYDSRDILGYKNGVLQGKWIRKTIKYYEKQGIDFNNSSREIMSAKSSLIYEIKKYLSGHLNKKNKAIIKKIMRKFGIKFMIE